MAGDLVGIYRKLRRELFTCALAITRSPHQAEDAVQEAFSRLFRSSVRPRNLKAYVFRAVRNAALDQVRQSGTRPAGTLDGPGGGFDCLFAPGPGPLDAASNGELERRVAKALGALSENERDSIVQHLYCGLTFRDISEIREAPLGTVTTWYQRGLRKLRDLLTE